MFYTETFTHRNFYTQKTLTQRNLYIQKLLHTETFTHRSCFTKNLYTEELLHQSTFMHRRVYTHTHTVAFAHRNFCAEKSLSIFHHVSFSMIIHHLSSSRLRFHPLLVASLRRLVFISHSVLSVYASFSLPLRRSKLNENPGINSD